MENFLLHLSFITPFIIIVEYGSKFKHRHRRGARVRGALRSSLRPCIWGAGAIAPTVWVRGIVVIWTVV